MFATTLLHMFIDAIFKGLADPVRQQIVNLLSVTPLNVNQINHHFPDMSRQAVSRHIQVLEDTGIIRIYQAGRERYGYLNKKAFLSLFEWMQTFLSLEKVSLKNDYEVFLPQQDDPEKSLTYPVMLQAMLSKDPAFDGIFYIAVKTTGIFCRPSCGARPKPENVLFYTNRGDVLKNKFRPCKKCKP